VTMPTKYAGTRVINTRKLVLTATFSALYILFRAIPTFPNLAIPGTAFRAGDIVAPLYGILLGPFYGPMAIVIGTIGGYFTLAPSVFLGFDFLPASICAVVVGLLVRGNRLAVTTLYTGLLLAFVLLPFTAVFIRIAGAAIPYNWLHIVGLALLVSPLAGYAIRTISPAQGVREQPEKELGFPFGSKQFLSILLVAFIGTLAQHLMGGILTEAVIGLNFHGVPGRFASWSAFWTFVFFVYPFERSVIAILAALLATPVFLALKTSKLINRLR
jgi:hypothetical protein